MNPKLTIVSMSYNHEKFIAQAIDSFLMQKTNFPFEVIISDDASTDRTPEIIQEFAEKYPEIIKPILHTQNLGMMGNWVDTLSRVKSEYVIICESDDYFTDPLKLQKQVNFLDTHPDFSVCFHPVKVVFDNVSMSEGIYPSPAIRFNKNVLSLNDLVSNNFIQTNSAMYRWRFNSENISELYTKDIIPGDWFLHLLHAEKGLIGFIDEIMCVYRTNSEDVRWLSNQNISEHFRKYGFQELKLLLCMDKHFNYKYTEIFTKRASIIASNMIKTFNENNDSEQLKRLQVEHEKYYLKGLENTKVIVLTSPVKLHIGCGTVYLDGWINIDNNSDNNIKKLDINFDLRNPLPFKDDTVDFIFNEHFLEHLTIQEGQRVLKDFKRVLKPNGVLRIAMPDLEDIIKEYFNPSWKDHPFIKEFGLGFVQTKAELINIHFRFWGHKHLYDKDELERRLKEVGFENIKFCEQRKSEFAELNNLETRDQSTLIAEVRK